MCLVQVHVTVVFNITFKSSAPIIFYTDVLDTVVQSEHGMSTSKVVVITMSDVAKQPVKKTVASLRFCSGYCTAPQMIPDRK